VRHFGTELGTQNAADFALDAVTSARKSMLFDPIMRTSFVSTSIRWAGEGEAFFQTSDPTTGLDTASHA
jgi:hypothetical protein